MLSEVPHESQHFVEGNKAIHRVNVAVYMGTDVGLVNLVTFPQSSQLV